MAQLSGGNDVTAPSKVTEPPVAVTEPVGSPDLVVTSISHLPTAPLAGESVVFTATVRNLGDGPTPEGTSLSVVYRDSSGTVVAESTTLSTVLQPGATSVLTTSGSWLALGGPHVFSVTTDDEDNIVESDETNNSLAFSVLVALLPPPGNAAPVSRFLNSIGVNTHFAFSGSRYATQYARVKSRLLELGITHIRDGSNVTAAFYKEGTDVSARFNDLAALGIRLDLIANAAWTDTDILDVIHANHAAIEAIEGQNEGDNFLSGDWVTIDRTFQMLLWNTVKGSAFNQLPVYGPSLASANRYATLGDLAAYMDLGNIHPYPGARLPTTPLNTWISAAANTSGNLPIVVTETGYHSALKTRHPHPPISEKGAAKYIPRLFLDYFNRGIPRTYLYQLYDHIPKSTTNPEANFGLVRYDFTVRPAFVNLRNMITILKDSPGSPPGGVLNYSLSGASSVRSALFQKTNGRFYLALWNDVSVWNVSTRRDITNKVAPVTLKFGENKTVRIYRPSAGTGVRATMAGTTLTINVPDEVLILEVF
jgi:hypothetical protein